ncbi:MAG TPA: MFS transporter [Gemmatimonadales bacterium]|nr:MFS transporter [Gemmatimonadales bacterium]
MRLSSLRVVFAALRHRNFRLFLTGQFISLCGTWMQTIAQGWLVLQLTDSAFAVGLVTALGSLPILMFSLYGGVIADRVNKRRFLILLQSLMLAEALTLAVLTALHLITVHWVMGLAAFSGLLTAFEVPTRQAFVADLVDREDLMNAIALGSSAFNLARVVGPALAGTLIATVGLSACFFANAASYLAVIVSLGRMDVRGWRVPAMVPVWAALREGFAYVFGHRWPRALISIVATFSIFGFSFVPLMPVFARDALRLDASGYGALVASIGIGAVGAAFFMAGFGDRIRQSRRVLGSSTLFGAVLLVASFAPDFLSAVLLFTVTGGVMALNGIAANTMLQSEAPDELRGRVMGFYSFMVLGLAPFGSLQAGWIAEHFGVRFAYAFGGLMCLLVAVSVAWRMGKGRREARERRRRWEMREARETGEGRKGAVRSDP